MNITSHWPLPKFIALATVALTATAAATILSPSPAEAQEKSYFRTDTPEFQESMKLGHQMFGAYQCSKCHAITEGQPLTDDIVAPNLILSKERLRPEWILQWLIDPQSLQPGTKMPNFFSFNEDDDGNPIYDDADAHQQYKIIVALRDYLMVLGTEMDPDYVPGALASAAAPAADASDDQAADAAPADIDEDKPEEVEEWEDSYY